MLEIQNNELVEVGSFIDRGGNNFWGVQVFNSDNTEYVAASDMRLRPVHLQIHRRTLRSRAPAPTGAPAQLVLEHRCERK
ncbi:MAG: hypothetical protein WKF47_12405 [Geodermatophilaceae bacterium]